jgi:hypothetical protein
MTVKSLLMFVKSLLKYFKLPVVYLLVNSINYRLNKTLTDDFTEKLTTLVNPVNMILYSKFKPLDCESYNKNVVRQQPLENS